ncbi:hypothetical protein CROQUDRAFT_108012 [Cronartium quercuum f. sp. fusiforme G11]|uniref:TRUD domain-containing protein n=1 Tax=Cronartium quercuum f. sp. fusiforme G11 TaxID=708437 RepID=A0A9P6TAD7_9BASI|nr:hypothetical protein CROQUDRAFT_108012 [Cronartium quercuum f. sp. fusiforme G11]
MESPSTNAVGSLCSTSKKREASAEIGGTEAKKGRPELRTQTSSSQTAKPNNDSKTLLDTIDMTQTCLSEEQVGIQCYINTHLPTFSAILKHRFTDFLVYEVDKAGEVVRLKDITEHREPGEEPAPVSKNEKDGQKDTAASKAAYATEWPADGEAKLVGILSEQKIAQLKEFVCRGPQKSNRSSKQSKGRDNKRPDRRGPKNNKGPAADAEKIAEAPKDESKLVTNDSTLSTPHEDQPTESSKVQVTSEPIEPQNETSILSDLKWRTRTSQISNSESTSARAKPIDCKEQRKKFHQVFRDVFQGRLATAHKEAEGGGAVVEISWAPPGGNQERKGRSNFFSLQFTRQFLIHFEMNEKSARPIDVNPPYIHFTLQKTNRETQEALSILANLLHCHVSRDLGICGTKDKRSVSCQRVSFKRGRKTIQQVWSTVNRAKNGRKGGGPVVFRERGDKGIRVGDFTYEADPLKLGDLSGNRFVIVLRDVVPSEPEVLKDAVDALSKSGFLNYFGMQRFGTTAVGTHLIGLSLLRADWDLAIDLIMRKKLGETQDAEHARSVWEQTKDPQTTLDLMPKRCVAERFLQFFSKQSALTDKVGALASIPKNLKMMYIHAYQSYIWNTILSERVRLYGCAKPVVGDLILVKDGGHEIVDDDIDGDVDSVDDTVKVLRDEDECGLYTIHDVVLPLIGYKVKYPENQLGQMYIDMMKRDGLDPKKLQRSQAEYSMGGAYRKILHMPTDVKCKLYEYEDPDLPLSQADEDVLLGMKMPELVPWSSTSIKTDQEPIKNLALKVELTLGSSAYATMALREILKSDTGKEAQSKMTLRMRERMAKST